MECHSGQLKEPERLHVGLDAMIEQQRPAAQGDPEAQTKPWLDNLISFDERRARIAELDETRRMADRQLRSLRSRQERVRQLEEDKEALPGHYPGLLPEGLDNLDVTERIKCSGWRPP